MALLVGERAAEIEAPPDRCFAIVADVERWPEWQEFTHAVRVRSWGPDGLPEEVETEARTPVRALRHVMRYRWDPPHGIAWTQVESELRHLAGSWRFEPAGHGRTRATLRVEGDPGTRLALVIRGPLFEAARDWLLGRSLDELRARAAAPR